MAAHPGSAWTRMMRMFSILLGIAGPSISWLIYVGAVRPNLFRARARRRAFVITLAASILWPAGGLLRALLAAIDLTTPDANLGDWWWPVAAIYVLPLLLLVLVLFAPRLFVRMTGGPGPW